MKEYIEKDKPFSLLKNYLNKPNGQYNAQEVVYLVDDLISDIPAADVVEAGYKVFAEWVARIIFNGGLEDEAFCELACRKLNDLGIVEKTENEWHFDDPVRSITPAYIVDGGADK